LTKEKQKVPDTPDPDVTVIKVTTNDPKHSYYAHFNRRDHTLIEISEYKVIYTSRTGVIPNRIKDVIASARTKLKTPEGAKS
jgi:hypothetical protein